MAIKRGFHVFNIDNDINSTACRWKYDAHLKRL